MEHKRQKVLVIGLDGATFDIIDLLIERGKLPQLSSLIKRGTRASLKSTIMPNSFPAWVSCITGVNPGKHGIFWPLIRRDKNAYPLKLVNSHDIQAKAVWEILENQDNKVCVINLPPLYPPTKINGILVCGSLTPGEDHDFTYPQEFKDELLKLIPDYKCEIDYAHLSLEKLAARIMQSIENREKLLLYLLENKAWDLFFAVFTETDLAQHKFWAGIDRRHAEHPRFKENFGTFIFQVYERLDETLGKIMKTIPQDAIVFVISDHGFGPLYQSFSLSRWLTENRYLVFPENLLKRNARKILEKAHMMKKAQRIKDYFARLQLSIKDRSSVRHLREKDALSGKKVTERIDWQQTKAYPTSDFGIRINLQGREPQGIVKRGREEEEIKKEMKRELSRLKYSNGEPVFESILTKEEAFSGPFVDKAPDIIVPINHSRAPSVPEKWSYSLTHPTLNGAHSPFGIFIANGEGIKKRFMMMDTKIIDITPTLLYVFGVPLTKDMDGKVLLDIFEPEFIRTRKTTKEGYSKENKI